jgi:hypothetical protein
MRVPQVSERIKEAPAHALRGVFAGIGQLLLVTDKLRNKASHQDVPQARMRVASETVTDTTVTSPAGRDAETARVDAASAAAAAPAAPPAAPAPAKAVAEGDAVAAEVVPAKPATSPRRTAAKPVTGKPVTAKPPAKPATAKPATPRRTAAKAAAAEAAESAGETAPKPPKRQSTRNFDKTGNVRVLGDKADSPAASAAPAAAAAPEPAAAVPESVPTPETAAAAEHTAGAEPTAAAAPLPNYDELSVASLRARLRNLDVAQVRQLAEYERAHAARADVLSMFERRIAKLEAEA